MIILETNQGEIKIQLDQENTPKTAANFLLHVEQGDYDDTIFHRVIPGFMIQGGGFKSGLEAKNQQPSIENEANQAQPNKRGTIAMARTSDPHSASVQFFINLTDNSFLDFKSESREGWGYCVFGEVVEGMDVVDKIAKTKTTAKNGHQDVPVEDIMITKAYVEEQA